jgi:alkylation response protein AidB-like acyl-CoA dehydrogenase
MDLKYTEEQLMIRQTARDFAVREIRPVAAFNEKNGVFPVDIIKKLAGLGLMGINVPAEYGGAQAGAVAYSLAVTEIARECASTSVAMSVTNMVAEAICAFGTEEQKKRHVPRITSGEHIAGSWVLTEPGAGSDAAAIRTTAAFRDGRWVLNGSKIFVTSGGYSGVFIVMAVTDRTKGARGITAFLAEPGAKGLAIGKKEDKMGLRASNTVSIDFDDCELPGEAVLGEVGGGFKVAMTGLNGGRIGIASQALGIGSAALDAAIQYSKERTTFGRPLANHQAIQWMIADSAVELDAARMLTLRAAWLKETKHPFMREASMAKLYATEAANRVCYRAMQIFGGYGYTTDFPMERYYRDVRATTIYEGTSEVQRMVISRDVLKE